MALTYPLTLAQFFDLTDIQTGKFTLPDARQFDTTAGGEILESSLGSRLWMGEVTLISKTHKSQAQIEAFIEALMEPGTSFLAYDKRAAFPASDPTGSILGAATPVISSVAANNKDLTISGLPAAYVLTRGDMLSFTYSSSPTRYALHRVVVGATASGGGVATVEVTPPIRPGFAVSAAITLIKAKMQAKIVPGSYQPSHGDPGLQSSGVSFQFSQTLRG
jgi:hypothetical protein